MKRLLNQWSRQEQIDYTTEYIQKTIVDKGMCADWSIHDKGDGNPHVHLLVTMRPFNPDRHRLVMEYPIQSLPEFIYWLIRILVCGGCLVGAGTLLAFIGIKIAGLYKNKICAKMPKQVWNNIGKNDEIHKNI